MIHQKIDTEGLQFEVQMLDVEALNQKAFRAELDITKLSYHAFAYLTTQYALLQSGSALGNGVGPLLIAKKMLSREEINQSKIAIAGKYTTANFLFSLAYPEVGQKEEILFSEIEKSILEESVQAGVIIHENRFTYMEKGLVKIMDLGDFWEQTTQMPIPLGGIVVNRKIKPEMQQRIQRVMQRSVEYAFANPESSRDFVAQYAQEMSETVRQQHINLYVNEFTRHLGEKGQNAVKTMLQKAEKIGLVKNIAFNDIFVQ